MVVGGELPLVGRDFEATVVDSVLDRATAGQGGLLLVSGDPGIGKSRLLAELSARARARGMVVGEGRALEAVRVAPYALLADAVETVLGSPLDHWRSGAEAPNAPAEQAREDFFGRLAAALGDRAATQPVLLVLDDLHWADTPTLRFLATFARDGVPVGLLIAVGYRRAAVQVGEELTELLAALAANGVTDRIDLDGLSAAAVGELSSVVLGHPLDTETLGRLVDETEGNPLFVVELARSHRRDLTETGLSRPPLMPAAVRESVYSRLAHLPDDTTEALSAAAVLGAEFDLGPLAQVLGEDPTGLLARLAPAERVELIGTTETSWRQSFTHPLVWRVIHDGLTSDERIRLHLAAAEAVEAVSPPEAAGRHARLAYHYAQAVPLAGARPAIDHACRAADHAVARLAFEDASRFYGEAIELAERHGNLEPGEWCELALRQADALLGGGETSRARSTYAEAAERAAVAGDVDRLARGALGRAGYRGLPGVPDVEAIALLERSLATPAVDGLLQARVAARLAMELYYLGERDRRDHLSASAVDLVRPTGDGTVLAQVLISRHYALDEVANVAERTAVAVEAARVAEAAGDGDTAMLAHYLLVRDRLEVGDRPAAEAAAERHRELAVHARQPLHPWRVLLLDALFAHLDGDIDRAEALALQAFATGSAASIPNAGAALGGLLFLVRLEQGRLPEILEATLDGQARHPRYSTWAPMVAWCRLASGDRRGARVSFTDAMAGLGSLEEDEAFLPTGFALAAVAVGLGDVAACERLLDRFALYADRVAVVTGPTACCGPVALFLGRLATVAGRTEEAKALLRSAAVLAERLASPVWTAQVTAARAEVEVVGGVPSMPLTEREVEVLALISSGLTNREVAARLQLGVRTIDSHVATLYRKVGARRRADAVAYGLAHGLVEPPVP